MAERRSTMDRPKRGSSTLDLEQGLQIDRDDLDGCLIGQPDSYYHVAAAHAEAVSQRDRAKLELDELEAQLDRDIRASYEDLPSAADGEKRKKPTETAIQQEIRLDPKYSALKRRVLDLTAQVDRAYSLKEAFQQRSFMLRELVALTIAERGDQTGAGGAYEARARKADDAYRLRGEHLARRSRITSA